MEMICFLEISLGMFPGDAAHQTWKKGDHGKLQNAIFSDFSKQTNKIDIILH